MRPHNAESDLPVFTAMYPQTVEGLELLHKRHCADSSTENQGPLSERDMIQNVLLLAQDVHVEIGELANWNAQEIRHLWEIMLQAHKSAERVEKILQQASERVATFVQSNEVPAFDE